MNQKVVASPSFNFQLSQPAAPLADFVQGIWAASVNSPEAVSKPLYSDAGSGIIFNLSGQVTLGERVFSEGVILTPVKQYAEQIVLAPNTELAGIRFLPAMGYGVLGQQLDQPMLLADDDPALGLNRVFQILRQTSDDQSRIIALTQWAENNLALSLEIPKALADALVSIGQPKLAGKMNQGRELSQRQIERLFKLWLGMTPKYYQRIVRIQKAVRLIQQGRSLVDVAFDAGFSDQAHMTREFRAISSNTPGKIQ